ncbi:MAG TPA: hypothetical protein VFG83_06495 [Kofleriaceae bacterium]|nr:hypothetical protein [Kofleriaceae bacterium]
MIKILAYISICATAAACTRNDDVPADPDANVAADATIDPADAATDPQVACQTQGLPYDLTVDGTVIDFVTGEAYTEPVDLVAGDWDIGFICWRQPITASDGTVAFHDPEMLTVRRPPIFGLAVADTETDLAGLVTDRTMTCTDREEQCAISDYVMPVLAADIADGWRTQMAADGMADAATRGLILYQFREVDGSGAAGVTATLVDSGLVPGVDVRFVDADRTTLLPPETAVTGESGLAIIALPAANADVMGTRGSLTWAPVGVIAIEGKLFIEATRPTTATFVPLAKGVSYPGVVNPL